jgi:hypothetical protein
VEHNSEQKIVPQLKKRVKAVLHLLVCGERALAVCVCCFLLSVMQLAIRLRNPRLA